MQGRKAIKAGLCVLLAVGLAGLAACGTVEVEDTAIMSEAAWKAAFDVESWSNYTAKISASGMSGRVELAETKMFMALDGSCVYLEKKNGAYEAWTKEDESEEYRKDGDAAKIAEKYGSLSACAANIVGGYSFWDGPSSAANASERYWFHRFAAAYGDAYYSLSKHNYMIDREAEFTFKNGKLSTLSEFGEETPFLSFYDFGTTKAASPVEEKPSDSTGGDPADDDLAGEKVTEAQWNAAFEYVGNCDNATVNIEALYEAGFYESEEERVIQITQRDGNKIKVTEKIELSAEEFIKESYMTDFNGKLYEYGNDGRLEESYSHSSVKGFWASFLDVLDATYNDFNYNESSKAYEMSKKYARISVKIVEGKLRYINMLYLSEKSHVTFRVDYGNAKVTLPKEMLEALNKLQDTPPIVEPSYSSSSSFSPAA